MLKVLRKITFACLLNVNKLLIFIIYSHSVVLLKIEIRLEDVYWNVNCKINSIACKYSLPIDISSVSDPGLTTHPLP